MLWVILGILEYSLFMGFFLIVHPTPPSLLPTQSTAWQISLCIDFLGGDTVVVGQEVTCCVLIHTGSHSGCGAPY